MFVGQVELRRSRRADLLHDLDAVSKLLERLESERAGQRHGRPRRTAGAAVRAAESIVRNGGMTP